MRPGWLLIVICFWTCAVTVHSQNNSRNKTVEMTVGQDAAHARLQLTTDVLDQKYSSDGRLQFGLRFTFTNHGANSILLDKRSSIIPQYMVSKTIKAASEKRYELNSSRLISLGNGVMSFETTLDESLFVVLRPGEVFSLNGSLTLPLRDGKSGRKPSLRPGSHVLQVVVLTWYYPKVSNVRSRAQWAEKGYLWSDPVTSRPMEFVVKEMPKILTPSGFVRRTLRR